MSRGLAHDAQQHRRRGGGELRALARDPDDGRQVGAIVADLSVARLRWLSVSRATILHAYL
jgi:hypothetical protein